MTTTPDELLQDAHEQEHGRHVDIGCACGESWSALLFEGECLTEEQLACANCGGEGAEQ